MWRIALRRYVGRMNNLCISQVMTRGPVTIAPDQTVYDATALMERHDVHHLLVVEHDRMVGILSSADLLKLALLACPGTHQSPADSGAGFAMSCRPAWPWYAPTPA
jgi:CBS domain-containing protein